MSFTRSFDPREFYDLVKDSLDCVLDRNNEECSVKNTQAFHRTLISRTYYSVFLRLRDIYFPYTSGSLRENIHSKLINYLRNNGYKDIADKLQILRKIRNQADYDLDIHISEKIVEFVFKIAQKIHEKIDEGLIY